MDKKLTAIVDIATASVSGALVRDGEFLFSCHENAVFGSRLDFNKFFLGLQKTLEKVLVQLEKNSPKRPDRFVCFLPAPFYMSETKTVVFKPEKKFNIDRKLLHRLSEDLARDFLSEQSTLFPDLENDENIVLENKIVQIKLNDYIVEDFLRRNVSSLETTNYLSVGSNLLSEKIKSLFEKVFHDDQVEFHSFAFALFSGLRDLLPKDSSFTIVDVGGELTDLIFVRRGVLNSHVSFPFGRRTILKKITAKLKTAIDESQSTLNMFLQNKLNENTKEKVAVILDEVKQEWVSEIHKYLKNQIGRQDFYLVDTDEFGKLLADWLSQETVQGQQASFVHFVEPALFSGFFKGRQPQVADTFLLAAAIFCAKIE